MKPSIEPCKYHQIWRRGCKACEAEADADIEENKTKMKPHQERVVTEKNELDEKRDKLIAFIGGQTYRTLDSVEQSRLNRQLEAMSLYSGVLKERIAAFTP